MPIIVNGEEYLTASEAARELGVSTSTFNTNTKGQIRPYTVGVLRRTYYKRSDIDRYKGARPSDESEE